jgi:hypothetical protein
MTDESSKAGGHDRDARQDRLKSALRANLKRRKVQARERGKAADPSHNDDASLNEEVAGKTGE